MEKSQFRLKQFKLKDRQDVSVNFSMNGKEITQKFTEPVHPDLITAFGKFDEVFKKITGLEPGENKAVEAVELRGFNLVQKGDSDAIILTGVVSYKAGKGNVCTPKVFVEDYIDIYASKTIEDDIQDIIDEVFELVYKNKKAQLEIGFEESEGNA